MRPFSRLPREYGIHGPQLFFLQRLVWLQKQRRECVNVLPSSDWRIRLLNKALYSTYRDCVEAGVEQSAKQILGREQQSN